MAKPSPQHVADLAALVAKIQASKRLEVKQEILRLQAFVGSTEDLFVDGRRKMWAKGGKARTTVDARKATNVAPKRESPRNLEVLWRSSNSPVRCTLEEAAKFVQISPSSLRAKLAKAGRYDAAVELDVVTVKKLV